MNWAYKDVFQSHGNFICATFNKPMPYYIGNIFRYVLLGPIVVSTTILFARDILEKVGYQNEDYRLAEEYEMIVRICKKYSVGFLDYPTYLYRYHGDQISRANQTWTRKRALIWIEIEKVMLHTLLDWGIGDRSYYQNNSDWLNARAAELYHCIGSMWMEYGNIEEARKCFKQGLSYDSNWKPNQQYLLISFFPALVRRIYFGIINRIKKKFY
jgi:hypothetical protein